MSQDTSNPSSKRLASIDAYRGLVMFLLVAESLHLCKVAGFFPESSFWRFLCHHQSHVEWIGCSLHDLIQPSFSFLVGVAVPFSIASRVTKGQSTGVMIGHAMWRALALVFLGVFLRSLGNSQTRFTFEDTLTQIGLGYPVLFLLGLRSARDQWIALGVLLVGYWAAFALYPLPGPDFDYATVGVAKDWPHLLTGFEAHWNKNTNLAAAFDTWFLNLFSREKPFVFNGGGYLTLSFIPTLGTMIFGLMAGGVLRSKGSSQAKLQWLGTVGVVTLILGLLLSALGVCPLVKRIWTPTWTLFSGGWCLLFLAAFYAIMEVWNVRRWAFPLMVLGMNSIAIYCMNWLVVGFVLENLKRHLGPNIFELFGKPYATLVSGAGVILVFWLVLYWMYRRKLFLKI